MTSETISKDMAIKSGMNREENYLPIQKLEKIRPAVSARH